MSPTKSCYPTRRASVQTLERLIEGARDAVATSRMAAIRRTLPLDVAVLELLARLDVHDRAVLAGRLRAADGTSCSTR